MIIYFDGYCLGRNPSPIGGGYSVVNKKGKLLKHERINKVSFTNNEAELLGAFSAVGIAKPYDTIVTDSQIIIHWIWNGQTSSRADLDEMCKGLKEEILKKQINLAWLPRKYNLAGHYNEQFETKEEPATLRHW